MPLLERNDTVYPICHPTVETAFTLGQSRNRVGRAQWLAHNPDYYDRSLQQLPATGNIRIKMSKEALQAERQYLLRDDTPKFWAIRLDHAVKEDKQIGVRTSFNLMRQAGIHCNSKHGQEDNRHGDYWQPTYHFGHWLRQSNPPQISADTIQPRVALKTQFNRQKAILTFCGKVTSVLEGLASRISKYDEPALNRQKYICANAHDLAQNQVQPAAAKQAKYVSGCKKPLGFGKLGTMLAATTGQSETVHIDPSDYGYTMVMPISPGGWGDDLLPAEKLWGQVELPQLGYRIPLRPGQVLIFRASNLLHRVTPLPVQYQEHRLALTIFACTYLAEEVMEANQATYQSMPVAGPSFWPTMWFVIVFDTNAPLTCRTPPF